MKLLVAIFLCFFSANLCAEIEITDSHGKYRFKSPPERFVVLNWALAEQLLELGENPVGIAGLDQFEQLSSRYMLPPGLVDVGARLNPDLDKIRALRPEVIFIGYSQRSLIRPLSNIATVIYFKNFGSRYDNSEKSTERFLELAKLFDKQRQAQQTLSLRNNGLRELKRGFGKSNDMGSSLLLLAPSGRGDSKYGIFGVNSMPYYAASLIGINVLSPKKTDGFGVAQLSKKQILELIRLHGDGDTCIILFDKYSEGGLAEPLSAMEGFNGCLLTIDYQQAFGGMRSLQWLAEDISNAILAVRAAR